MAAVAWGVRALWDQDMELAAMDASTRIVRFVNVYSEAVLG
jgi:hypothetical protein